MDNIDKYIRAENYERFVNKIFKRHDRDKDQMLSKEEFTRLMNNFQDKNLMPKDIEDIYNRMREDTTEEGDGIDYLAFLKNSIN